MINTVSTALKTVTVASPKTDFVVESMIFPWIVPCAREIRVAKMKVAVKNIRNLIAGVVSQYYDSLRILLS